MSSHTEVMYVKKQKNALKRRLENATIEYESEWKCKRREMDEADARDWAVVMESDDVPARPAKKKQVDLRQLPLPIAGGGHDETT
jgi:hypothetical protein